MTKEHFQKILNFLTKTPSVHPEIGFGEEGGYWWLKFRIDVGHLLAWNVIQELSHVINYLSGEQRLPTMFYPVSPPPFKSGGPEKYLSWVIEVENPNFIPDNLAGWLEARLPNPVDDLSQWQNQEEK